MRVMYLFAMLGTLALVAVAEVSAGAGQFALQTGPPAAAMPDPTNPGQKKFKNAVFVVRSSGCADASAFRLSARAEGLIGTTRSSGKVALVPVSQPGVFAVLGALPAGTWVVALSGTCGTEVAGAMVRMSEAGYRREGVKLLATHPTQADIERALGRPGQSRR